MLKTLHTVCAYLIVALGTLHVLSTLFDYDAFTLRALWFAGAGLAIIFAGFLNLALLKIGGRDSFVRALCFIANLILTILFGVALSLMREPQVFLGLTLSAFAAIASLLAARPSPLKD